MSGDYRINSPANVRIYMCTFLHHSEFFSRFVHNFFITSSSSAGNREGTEQSVGMLLSFFWVQAELGRLQALTRRCSCFHFCKPIKILALPWWKLSQLQLAQKGLA